MNIDNYIGYILEEDAENLRVMIVKSGYPIVDIPRAAMMKPTMFDLFKTFVETKISLLKVETAKVKPSKASSFEELEGLLSNGGFTNREILDFYRDFLKIYENNGQAEI
jgi:hypothetical protein